MSIYIFHTQQSPEEVAKKLKELDYLERKWYAKIFAQDREIEFRDYLLRTKPHLSLEKLCSSTMESSSSTTNKSNTSDHFINKKKNNNKHLINNIGTNRSNSIGGNLPGGNISAGNFHVWGYPHPHSHPHPHPHPHHHPQAYINHHHTNTYPNNQPPNTLSTTATSTNHGPNYFPGGGYYYMQPTQPHLPRPYPISNSNPNPSVDIQRLRSTSVSSVISNASNCSPRLPNSGPLIHVHSNSSLNGLNASFTTASSNYQNKSQLPPSPNMQGMKFTGNSNCQYQESPYPPTRNNSFISLQGNLEPSNSNQRIRNDSVGSFGSLQHTVPPRHPIMISSPLIASHPPKQQQVSTIQTSPFLKSGHFPRVNSGNSMTMQQGNVSNPSVNTATGTMKNAHSTSSAPPQYNHPTYNNPSPHYNNSSYHNNPNQQYPPYPSNQLERHSLMLPVGSKPPGLPSTPYSKTVIGQSPSLASQQRNLSEEGKDNSMTLGRGQQTTSTKRKLSDSFADGSMDNNKEREQDSPKKVRTAYDSTLGHQEGRNYNNPKETGEQKV